MALLQDHELVFQLVLDLSSLRFEHWRSFLLQHHASS